MTERLYIDIINLNGQYITDSVRSDIAYYSVFNTQKLLFASGCNVSTKLCITSNNIGINTVNPSVSLHMNSTDALFLASGTDAQRPSVPTNGMIRYNTNSNLYEGYTNNSWYSLSAGSNTGNLIVSGTSTFNNNVVLSGANTLITGTGLTSLGGTLQVTGITSLSNNLIVSSAGSTTLGSTLQVTGITSLSNNLIVSSAGSTTLGKTLQVTGATSLSNTLNVTGLSSLATLKIGTNGTTMSQIIKITSSGSSTAVTGGSLYYYCLGSTFTAASTSCYFTYTALFTMVGTLFEIGVSTTSVSGTTTVPSGVIVSNLGPLANYSSSLNLVGGTVEITGLTVNTTYYPLIRYKPTSSSAGNAWNIHGYIRQF